MAKFVPAHDFTIGWVCAHSLELGIAIAMMGEQLPGLTPHPSDSNIYAFGCVEGHYVVAAYSPIVERGTSPVVIAARHMRLSFPSVRLGISIGIVSGALRPSNDLDICLDDVIINQSLENYNEVVRYGLGKIDEGRVIRMENEIAPLSTTVMGALEKLRAKDLQGRTRVLEHLSEFFIPPESNSLGSQQDALLGSNQSKDSIRLREARAMKIQALPRSSIISPLEPMIDGSTRESYLHELDDVSLFDTEADDLKTDVSQFAFPLVKILGKYDCADKYESKKSQQPQSAAAASYGKELLRTLPLLLVPVVPGRSNSS
ncbi:hypothetical protein LY78DRAFT_580437 [Colletotrichum sublineola]|nr:hypothetical protein LY78DRAFT_580437 [Colletotrichum sublineola]